jgi:hypothetical protein
MLLAPEKIAAVHLRRLAIVYLRQSSPRQVRENFRSTERQYGLAEEAVRLGWEPERIFTVDGDLGISGRFSDAQARQGYKQLVSRVCLGEVGAIFGLEVSRLARSNAETQRLLEFCALTDTLVVDTDGIYDLKDFNDRLLLGLSVSDFGPSLTSSARASEPLSPRCRLVICTSSTTSPTWPRIGLILRMKPFRCQARRFCRLPRPAYDVADTSSTI